MQQYELIEKVIGFTAVLPRNFFLTQNTIA